MRHLISKAIPPSVRSRLSASRAALRNLSINQHLCEHYAQELPSELIANLTVVANRLALLEQLPKAAVVAEIGVASGGFSRKILDTCNPTTLHLIDPWDSVSDLYDETALARVQARYETEIEAGTVVLHRGYSTAMLHTFPDRSLDWLYLDAAHDFENVRKDLEACKPKLKFDGILAGHDYTRWAHDARERYGVIEAVNAFCVQEDWEMIYLSNELDRHLSYAIRKRQSA